MKNSLAIAYAMKRKARRMADGGSPQGDTLGSKIGYPGADKKAPKMMAQGGQLESGYLPLPENDVEQNASADQEDDKDLNQRLALGGDVVERIMARRGNRTNMLSEGGQVANSTTVMADELPAEYDDLVLRDDLESSSDGANNGDFISNEQEDADRADIVARVMRSRAKKDRLPSPR